MHLDKYPLHASRHNTVFTFFSEGPKCAIRKVIEFQQIGERDVYNLAFGDALAEDSNYFDDRSVSDNGDTEIILATVVAAVYLFFERYPHAIILAAGSTPARTRLYRMGIARYWQQAVMDFHLFGMVNESYTAFEPNRVYGCIPNCRL